MVDYFTTNPFETRYYNQDPETMTLEQCQEYGRNHACFGWGKQFDPRWSTEQCQAYLDAYNSSLFLI